MLQRLKQKGWARRLLTAMSLIFVMQTFAWSAMPIFVQGVEDDWVIVCTSQGFKRIALSRDTSVPGRDDAPAPLSSDTHCDLCVFAQGLGTGSAQVLSFDLNSPPALVQAYENIFPITRDIHSCCLPRAPPVI